MFEEKILYVSDDTTIHMTTEYTRKCQNNKKRGKRVFSQVIKRMLISITLVIAVLNNSPHTASAQTTQSTTKITTNISTNKATYTQTSTKNIETTINGKKQSYKQKTVIKDGQVLVPMTSVFKTLGATVKANKAKTDYTITKEKITVTVTINSKTAKVNGKAYTLPTKAINIKGTPMVSSKLVTKVFGGTATLNKTKTTLTITTTQSSQSSQVVRGIKVKYGKHTYNSINQKEYDKVMEIIEKAIKNDFPEIKFGDIFEQYYYEYLDNGARWDGNLNNINLKNLALKVAENQLEDLVKAGVSREDIIKVLRISYLIVDLTEDTTDPRDGSPNSAYHALVNKKADCDAYAQVISAVFDSFGYNTAILAGDNHADALVQINGKWWNTNGDGYREEYIVKGDGVYILVTPTYGNTSSLYK